MFKEIYELRRNGSPFERLLLYSLLVLTGIYMLHFGLLSFLNSPWDFDHLAGYYELAWRFWTTQHFPSGFNPYLQGGRTLGGDPQIFLFSPWTFVAGIASPLMAVKLQLLTEVGIGAWGVWNLCSCLRMARLQRLWALFLFLSGGAITSRMATGHATLGYVFFYPLLLWLSIAFEERGFWKTKSFAWSLLLFAYLGNHKPNFFIYGLPPLFVEAFIRSLLRKNYRPLVALIIGTVVAGLVNAASLLPSYYYFQTFPRHDGDEWIPIPLYTFFLNLLMPLRSLPGVAYGPRFLQRHEYNLFLGPVVLYLAVLGGKYFRSRDRVLFSSLVFTAVLFVWVGLGASENALLSPYTFFYKLWPGFHSVRVPPRFWIFAAFTLSLFSSLAIVEPVPRVRRFLLVWFCVLPLLVSAGINLSKPTFESFGPRLLDPREYPSDIVWKQNDVRFQMSELRKGRGVLNSIENLAFPRAPGLEEKSVQMKDWSTIEYVVDSKSPTTVIFHLNAHPYWSLKGDGQIVAESNGPLTIAVGSGISKGTLEFKQPMAYEGLLVTLLSLGLVLLYMAWVIFGGKRKKASSKRIIGLTGGIGSGKSTVAALFREEGIPVIDLDRIGREIIETDKVAQEKIKDLFGSLDRKKIREVVFANPEKRKKLEEILHPLIWKEFHRQTEKEFKQGKDIVLCEAALLIENKSMSRLNGLIVVMADEGTRKKRLLERDKISGELADQMLKSQVSDDERKKYATHLIENQAGFYDLKEKVKGLVKNLNAS